MAARHGTRTRFNAGCKCGDCREANNVYQRAYQRDRKSGEGATSGLSALPPVSSAPAGDSGPGPVELAVMAEIEGLSTVESRPGLVAVALAHARVLDDPVAVSQHASNGHRLAEALDKLRKGADARSGRLASVRAIGRTG